MLTFWQGDVPHPSGQGVDVILNRHYQRIATVHAGNGLMADLHEFTITPQGTAWITAYSLVHWDGTGVGRGKDINVLNCTVQEIDIPTGNVLFQWDSLDHIGLRDSYLAPATNPRVPYDYFHVNSVQPEPDGNLIVSARDTWTVYEINGSSGSVMWKLGGKHSSFRMGRGTRTAYQHDALMHSGGLLTIFDDGATPEVHSQSRAVLERINVRKRTATLVHEYDHRPKLLATYEGSVQRLANRHTFVGWGDAPYFTEFDRRGRQIFDGRLRGANSSYRAYEFSWEGEPTTVPDIAARTRGRDSTTVWASWNGATDVSRWRVLTGKSSKQLTRMATASRAGFETAIKVRGQRRYVAVQALASSGRVLAQSRTLTLNG